MELISGMGTNLLPELNLPDEGHERKLSAKLASLILQRCPMSRLLAQLRLLVILDTIHSLQADRADTDFRLAALRKLLPIFEALWIVAVKDARHGRMLSGDRLPGKLTSSFLFWERFLP